MTAPEPSAGRTAVYRLYDAAGELLYIGLTARPRVRWSQHEAEKSWWPQVCSKRVEWHDTRAAAFTAEARAIEQEKPKYNGPAGDVARTIRLWPIAAEPLSEAWLNERRTGDPQTSYPEFASMIVRLGLAAYERERNANPVSRWRREKRGAGGGGSDTR